MDPLILAANLVLLREQRGCTKAVVYMQANGPVKLFFNACSTLSVPLDVYTALFRHAERAWEYYTLGKDFELVYDFVTWELDIGVRGSNAGKRYRVPLVL